MKFIIYSRRSKVRNDGTAQHTHLTSEWHIQNYLRSLDSQGISYEVIASYEEDISGGGYYTNRPIFSRIIDECKKDKTLTLLVAKADRMTRNVRTGAELMETINFVLANAPDADDMQKQLEFMIAEREYKNNSQRWKDMYQAKKTRCEKAGEKMQWGANADEYKRKATNPNKIRRKDAVERAERLREPLRLLVNTIVSPTYKNLAQKLTELGYKLPSGGDGEWKPIQVQRVMEKLEMGR